MNMYYVLAGSMMVVGSIMLIQQVYSPSKSESYASSSTELIEPRDEFIKCSDSTNCIKIKGSACPPSEGGVEVCVNKNYFQQYISVIDNKAGSEIVANCPQVYLATNRTCDCVQNKCVMI
jgi:hypothetical protein